MKFTSNSMLTTALIAGTSASTTISTTTPYSLRITSSTNPSINGSTLALKDDPSANTSPNAMGIWSTGEPRTPYTFTFSPSPNATGLYTLLNTIRQTQLTLFGEAVAMQFFDVPIGVVLTPGASEAWYNDKWVTLDMSDKITLRHAQDWNTSATPTGGAGSWRACRSGNGVDYPVYWYDGSSPLPYEDCEGVQLEIVEAGTVGMNGTGSTGGNTTATGPAKPTSTQFESAASRLSTAGAVLGVAVAAATFLL